MLLNKQSNKGNLQDSQGQISIVADPGSGMEKNLDQIPGSRRNIPDHLAKSLMRIRISLIVLLQVLEPGYDVKSPG